MKKIFFALLLSFSLSSPAFAQFGKKGQVELSPYFGISFPDDYGVINPNEAPIAGLRLGFFFSDSISAELSGQRAFSEDGAGATNIDLDGYRLNLLWNVQTHARVRPFLTAGAGYERFDSTPTGAIYDIGYNGGVGFRFFAGDNAGIRLEGRYVMAKVDTGTENWERNIEGTLGMFFLFGKHEAKVVPAAPAAEQPKDSDGDGINDDADQCPGTPSGSKVDGKGCVVENDDDKDGVTNSDDKCPGTPENAPVDQTGCPMDSDGDNVKDYMDKCPNTPAGTQIDEMGCPLQSKARGVLNGVTFKTGSPELTDNANTVLNSVAAELKQFPEVKVEIQGHSDSTGDDALNLSLSQKRAESVMAYLVSQGIPAAQLSAKGYGESMPIADNKTAAGRAKNRRVEMKWID